MKIALVNFDLYNYGGVVTYQRHLYDMLKLGGHDPKFIHFGAKKLEKDYIEDGYKIYGVNKRDTSRINKLLDNFDIIHITGSYCKKPSPYHLKPFQNRKVFFTIHDPAENRGKSVQNLVKILCKNYKKINIDLRVFFIRTAPEKYYVSKYSFEKYKTVLHPYVRKGENIQVEKNNEVISTSRIDFDKYTEILIDHMDKINADVKIYSGFINSRYKFHILDGKYNWNKRNYYGAFTYGQMKDIYGKAKIMVDMSKIVNDGGGTQYTFLEAMDYGVVIIGNEGWHTENAEMKPEVHYLIANKDNLSDVVNNILEDDKKRVEIVNNCNELLKAHDRQKIIKEYLSFYRS